MIRPHVLPFLLLVLLLSGCRKEEHTSAPYSAGSSLCYTIIDGDTLRFSSDLPGFTSEAEVTKIFSAPPAHNRFTYSSQLYALPGLSPAIRIKKGALTSLDTIADDAAFIDFFRTGVHPWSVNALNGIEVILVDEQGAMWSTSEMGGYQGSNEFEIFEAVPFYENGICCVQFKARFSCTLRHPAYEAIELYNGCFQGVVKNR